MGTNVEDVAVGTVAGFVERLDSGGGQYAYFRGERKDYGDGKKLTASAFRDGKSMQKIDEMHVRFYEKVFARLTPNQEQHYLAFCRHYGLPTCILDITENALIALYFACEASEDSNDQEGYVYCFRDNFVDLTKLIDQLNTERFIETLKSSDLRYNPNRAVFNQSFYKWRLKNTSNADEYCNKLAHYIAQYPDWQRKGLYDKIIGEIDNPERAFPFDKADNEYQSSKSTILQQLKAANLDYKDPSRFYRLLAMFHQIDLLLYAALSVYISAVYNARQSGKKPDSPEMPKTIYKPLLSFDRAVAQSSRFIYQWGYDTRVYCSASSEVTEKIITKTIPDHTIRIAAQSKSAILHTLNTLGINRSTVYGDFDNIAQHIVKTTP
jgi:hypothetical protein